MKQVALLTFMFLAACTGTREAYQAAENPSEYAFVLTEHYASLVKEAANLKERPTTPAHAVAAMQAADKAVGPLIDRLAPLAQAWEATHSAADQAALQTAINEVVLRLADLINAVKAARGAGGTSSLIGECVLNDAAQLRRAA